MDDWWMTCGEWRNGGIYSADLLIMLISYPEGEGLRFLGDADHVFLISDFANVRSVKSRTKFPISVPKIRLMHIKLFM